MWGGVVEHAVFVKGMQKAYVQVFIKKNAGAKGFVVFVQDTIWYERIIHAAFQVSITQGSENK